MRNFVVMSILMMALSTAGSSATQQVNWAFIGQGTCYCYAPTVSANYGPPHVALATADDISAARTYAEQQATSARAGALRDAQGWVTANFGQRLQNDEDSISATITTTVTNAVNAKLDDAYKQSVISTVTADVAKQLSDPNGAFYKQLLRHAKRQVCADIAVSNPSVKCPPKESE